jgi:hypothetical protein
MGCPQLTSASGSKTVASSIFTLGPSTKARQGSFAAAIDGIPLRYLVSRYLSVKYIAASDAAQKRSNEGCGAASLNIERFRPQVKIPLQYRQHA